jgi:hypothetical protein
MIKGGLETDRSSDPSSDLLSLRLHIKTFGYEYCSTGELTFFAYAFMILKI